MTLNVWVLGAVMRPGSYPIEKPTSIMDLISLAGGLAPNAGSTATISHQGDSHAPAVVNASVNTNNANSSTNNVSATTNKDGILSINLTSLMSTKDPAANVIIHTRVIVTKNTAPAA